MSLYFAILEALDQTRSATPASTSLRSLGGVAESQPKAGREQHVVRLLTRHRVAEAKVVEGGLPAQDFGELGDQAQAECAAEVSCRTRVGKDKSDSLTAEEKRNYWVNIWPSSTSAEDRLNVVKNSRLKVLPTSLS